MYHKKDIRWSETIKKKKEEKKKKFCKPSLKSSYLYSICISRIKNDLGKVKKIHMKSDIVTSMHEAIPLKGLIKQKGEIISFTLNKLTLSILALQRKLLIVDM